MPFSKKDIEAEVIFLTPKEGGRKGPIFEGMRPTFTYDDMFWDGSLHYDLEGFLPKGEPVAICFGFTQPKHHIKYLYPGKEFKLQDGPKVIAKGKVLQLIDLEESARKQIESEK